MKPIDCELDGKTGPTDEWCSLVTKLVEAWCGELNAALALLKLRMTLEKALLRAEGDAINAAVANPEQSRRLRN